MQQLILIFMRIRLQEPSPKLGALIIWKIQEADLNLNWIAVSHKF